MLGGTWFHPVWETVVRMSEKGKQGVWAVLVVTWWGNWFPHQLEQDRANLGRGVWGETMEA